jgi:hypothetical protein
MTSRSPEAMALLAKADTWVAKGPSVIGAAK